LILAATAYKIHEIKLKRIIREQEHVAYFHLKLSQEFVGYVKKMVAMK
jgi:hypothetical protein